MRMQIDFRSFRKGYFTGAAIAIIGMITADLIYESGKRDGVKISNKKNLEALQIALDKVSPEITEEVKKAYEKGFSDGRDEGIRVGSLKNMEGDNDGDES